MSAKYSIGFDEFSRKASVTYAPVLEATREFFALGSEMLGPPASSVFLSLLRSVSLTVTNSYQSVLILTMNGCASDALKIARSMFESSVSVGYLQKNPGLVSDFLDYRWVKRHKYQEFLAQHAPSQFKALDPSEVAKTVVEYGRMKARFKGRSSWSDKNLREMAKDVGIEESYLAIYPFTSSVHHLDVIGVMAQEDQRILDVEVLPSETNIDLALSVSGLSGYVALRSFDEAAGLGKEGTLKEWFAKYRSALQEVARSKSSAVP